MTDASGQRDRQRERLFISYARVDLPIVRELVRLLHDGNYDPWYDHDLVPGVPWNDQLTRAIADCDLFVYVLTPESVASEYCLWEFKKAVELGKPVIPVLAQARTALPDALSKLQYVDFTDGATASSTAKLLGGLLQHAKKIPKKAVAQVSNQPEGVPSRVDELYEPAVKLAYDNDGISLALLKRELKIGYDRAKVLLETMQMQGIVGPYPGGGRLHPLL